MSKEQIALTPSAVNNYLKQILEKDRHLSFFKIKGEISNLKYHSNGNMYFSIKDQNAQINCIMFKSYAAKLSDKFAEGDSIEVDGSLYLYVKMGQYNINVRTMKKAGIGDLYQKYEQLKNEYEVKGYFNYEHKQAIPKYPQVIGVITATTGAAIQDILTTLKRRYPLAKVKIYPTLVQGSRAASNISSNIELANSENVCDVLIVGRGGGSIEDLWAFNEVPVIEAIYASKIPIISSVGHETDTTISDYVADIRAATPTAAAELAAVDISEIKSNLVGYKDDMVRLLKTKNENYNLRLQALVQNQYYQNPLLRFEMESTQLDNQLDNSYQQIINKIKMAKLRLENDVHLIESLNPLTILAKGYSVTKKDEQIVRSINDITIDDMLDIQLNDGIVVSKVISVKERK